MKVSIIIRCLNEEKHIGKLLTGIEEQDYNDIEVILVDSGSTDATLSIAERFSCSILHIKPEDFSFGYALNVGCKAASGDILLFASAHVYPFFKDWLSLMVTPFINDPRVGLVYGKQRGDERSKYSELQIFQKWFPDQSNMNQDHPFCNNANCAIRKSLWEKYPYDETLTGLEDLAWAKQIMSEDWKIAYQADATIAHIHEEKWKSVYNRYRREAIALRLIMKHETFNFLTFVKLLSINVSSDLRHALNERVFFKNFLDILLFRSNQFWGTYRGFKQSYLLDNKVRERFYYPKGYQIESKGKNNTQRSIDYSNTSNQDHDN